MATATTPGIVTVESGGSQQTQASGNMAYAPSLAPSMATWNPTSGTTTVGSTGMSSASAPAPTPSVATWSPTTGTTSGSAKTAFAPTQVPQTATWNPATGTFGGAPTGGLQNTPTAGQQQYDYTKNPAWQAQQARLDASRKLQAENAAKQAAAAEEQKANLARMNGGAYETATYEAKTGIAEEMVAKGLTVTPEMLVSHHILGIMKSPVGQIAMDIAREQMNSRGMLDSTAAQNAIVQAAIRAGLPIAEADAKTYFTAAQETMDAENAAAEANMNQANAMMMHNLTSENAALAANASATNTSRQVGVESADRRFVATTAAAAQKAAASISANAQIKAANIQAEVQREQMKLEDHWKAEEMKQQKSEFSSEHEVNQYNAESQRIQAEAGARAQNTQSGVMQQQYNMQVIQDITSSGMSQEAAYRTADAVVAAGAASPEVGASIRQYYQQPSVVTT